MPAPGTSTLPLNGPEATDGNGSTQWASVLRGVLIDRLQVAPEVEGSQQAAALPDEFVDRFLSPAAASASQVHAMISDWVGRIDVLVSAQLNEILHAAPFLEPRPHGGEYTTWFKAANQRRSYRSAS